MTDTKPLGRWANAPLILVLAQIRFEQIIGWENKLDAFHAVIAERYPRLREFPIPPVQGASSPHKLYEFKNAEQTKVIRLDNHSLTYTVTQYDQYEGSFANEWACCIDALFAIQPPFVNRLGLRYLDLVNPKADESPADYVVQAISQAPAIGDWAAQNHFAATEFVKPSGRLRIQYAQQQGAPAFPFDIAPLIQNDYAASDVSHLNAVIDMDRLEMVDMKLQAQALKSIFSEMHTDMSQAFQHIITPLARTRWGASQQGA